MATTGTCLVCKVAGDALLGGALRWREFEAAHDALISRCRAGHHVEGHRAGVFAASAADRVARRLRRIVRHARRTDGQLDLRAVADAARALAAAELE